MIKRGVCVIAAAASLLLCEATAREPVGTNSSEQASATIQRPLAGAENPDPHGPPPADNPLSRIPLSSLSASRERPLFSASRRPPAPPPKQTTAIAAAPPSPAVPDQPPFALVGTAIGRPRDIALLHDESAKNFLRLHVGEAASGWRLRSIDRREATFEKDTRVAILSLPVPGTAPSSPTALTLDQSNPPQNLLNLRPGTKTGANWILKARALY